MADYETVWSGSTGWTNGKGRYLTVPADTPQTSLDMLAAECRASSPAPVGRPRGDIVGTVRERILHQLDGGQWMTASMISKRLGIARNDRAAFQICPRPSARSGWRGYSRVSRFIAWGITSSER